MKAVFFVTFFSIISGYNTSSTDIVENNLFEKETPKLCDYYNESNNLGVLDIFTSIVYSEAELTGNDDYIAAVIEVIIHRVDNKHFPNTFTGVLYQKRQFDGKFETGWKHCGTDRYADVYDMVVNYHDEYLCGNYTPQVLPSKNYKHYYNPTTTTNKRFVSAMQKYYNLKLGKHNFVNH